MIYVDGRWKSTLRSKLIAPFIVGTICLTVFLVSYTYYSAHQAVADTVFAISRANTNSTINAISLLIKSLRSRAQDLVVDPGILNVLKEYNTATQQDNTTAEQTSRRLVTMTEGYHYFRDILLLDKNANCIASSNESYLGIDFSKEEYIKQALNGRYYLGNFSVGRVSKTFSAYFSAPIDIRGKLAGVLVIISDFPKLVQYDTNNTPVTGTISTSILTPNGIYIAHRNKQLLGDKTLNFQDTYDQLSFVNERGAKIDYIHNHEKYTGYARIEPNTQWLIITSGLTKDVFATAYRAGLIVFTISFTFLCIVSAIVIRYATNILDSLLSLISFAKHVSEGDLNLRLKPTTRTDELGILHNALENLVITLHESLEERENANQMKDEFLANMSHEIRTPLNAVIGMTYLAGQESLDPEKRNLYLNRINIAAQSLLGIINDILDISKVEAGKMTIETNPFKLRGMIEDTVAIHQESARVKNLTITMEYEESIPEHYLGDLLRIRQVLNNLLSNAIKFTKEGRIHLSCWGNTIKEGQAQIYFSIADTGTGIPEDVLPYLFSPFTQADASVTRQFGGTGLGLAICRHLVLLMDGNIWIESEVGAGSTFTFYITLPIATEDSIQEMKAANEMKKLPTNNDTTKGKRVLLAEDNTINQMIFKELLRPLEVEVTTVANGKQAVEAVATQGPFDLILMDMQMPVMGGLEATKEINALPQKSKTPIIALTANAREKDKSVALAAGIADYLTKPIDPHLFEKTIREILSS